MPAKANPPKQPGGLYLPRVVDAIAALQTGPRTYCSRQAIRAYLTKQYRHGTDDTPAETDRFHRNIRAALERGVAGGVLIQHKQSFRLAPVRKPKAKPATKAKPTAAPRTVPAKAKPKAATVGATTLGKEKSVTFPGPGGKVLMLRGIPMAIHANGRVKELTTKKNTTYRFSKAGELTSVTGFIRTSV
jgi:hypothetical protein